MWNKNVTELSPAQVEDARKILAKYKLRVTDIASPLFKMDWPGAPRSPLSEQRDQFHADYDAAAQDKLLERCLQLAKAFETDRIRCFDFWRLEDQKPYPRGHQCAAGKGRRPLRAGACDPAARKRDVVQHGDGRGGGGGAARDSE